MFHANLTTHQKQLEKIIDLINWFKAELNFNQSNLESMLFDASTNSNFKNLTFLNSLKTSIKSNPFPIAWNKSISNWQHCLNFDETNNLLKMSNVLGAYDSENQISALTTICEKFKISLNEINSQINSKGKISRQIGFLSGLAIFIFFL